jgi:hypothetical protein
MKKLLSSLLLSSILLPSFVSAITLSEKETLKKTDTHSTSTSQQPASSTQKLGFCAQIDKAFVYLDNKAMGRGEKKELKASQQNEKNKEARTEANIHPNENNTKREKLIEELTKRASTTEQKAALTNFITAMNKATLDKTTATDALIAAYKNEVAKISSTRKATIDTALTTLTTDIEAAKAKAKSDCKNNVQGELVRKNLKDSLQKAQEKFNATIAPLQKNAPTTTVELRKKELQVIEDTFKKSVERAKNDLKASFIKKTNTATTTITH